VGQGKYHPQRKVYFHPSLSSKTAPKPGLPVEFSDLFYYLPLDPLKRFLFCITFSFLFDPCTSNCFVFSYIIVLDPHPI
jgi:hypothetical protein